MPSPLDVPLDGRRPVTVDGRFGVRDWPGSWDDGCAGVVDCVVLAEFESATAPQPRGNLAIIGGLLARTSQMTRYSVSRSE